MKREIRFRAWHITEKKMCLVDVLTTNGAFLLGVANGPDELTNGGKMIIISPKNGRFCMNEEIEIMQFTGFHDKNGMEIYEGDITNHGVIVWDSDYSSYDLDDECLGQWALSVVEVIGNIYENPELLK